MVLKNVEHENIHVASVRNRCGFLGPNGTRILHLIEKYDLTIFASRDRTSEMVAEITTSESKTYETFYYLVVCRT
jgi:hypothetical protein